MNATVIDTLRFADRLKGAGFDATHAEGMARALGDELSEQMLTKRDLDDALQPIYARLDAMDAKIDSVCRELSGKFNLLVGVMALGFTLLVGLGGYNAVSPRFVETNKQAPEVRQEVGALPVTPPSLLAWNKRLRGAPVTGGGWTMGDERGRATGEAEGAGCGALLAVV